MVMTRPRLLFSVVILHLTSAMALSAAMGGSVFMLVLIAAILIIIMRLLPLPLILQVLLIGYRTVVAFRFLQSDSLFVSVVEIGVHIPDLLPLVSPALLIKFLFGVKVTIVPGFLSGMRIVLFVFLELLWREPTMFVVLGAFLLI